jgi:hypothetical protein
MIYWDADGDSVIFGQRLLEDEETARADAQDRATVLNRPCSVWRRQGVYTVCATPPEQMQPHPVTQGWELVALRWPRLS